MSIVSLATTQAPGVDEIARSIASARRTHVEQIEVDANDRRALVERVAALRPFLVVLADRGDASAELALDVARAGTPILLVRDERPLRDWLGQRGALRASVCVAASRVGRAPLHGLVALETLGPCDPVVRHVADPEREHERLGVPLPLPTDAFAPAVLESLRRDLARWTERVGVKAAVTYEVSPSQGRLGEQLAASTADVIVLGARGGRAGGGTLEAVLAGATTNVMLVPMRDVEPAAPRFSRVLAATDLSPLGDAAISFAYALVPRDGEVHVVHALVDPSEDRTQIDEHLRGLVPPAAAAAQVRTEIEVIAAVSVAVGIARIAERRAVDAICMASRARSILGDVVLGSVAREVMRLSRRPILLVPPERDEGEAVFATTSPFR